MSMSSRRKSLQNLGLAAALLIGATALMSAHAAVDPRFGFVGTGGAAFALKFGLPYYALEGNYPATGNVFSSVNPVNDPPPGHKVLRKVAKLNVRNDGLGQSNAAFQAAFEAYAQSLTIWYATKAGPKPTYTWFAPNTAALAAAESLQIVNTIRREKLANPAITGTVWEIGNEPNLFPAILPAEYAALYTRYHRIIKGEDSTAKIAFGPLFIRETGADLKPMTRELIIARLTAANALTLLGQARFDSLITDIADSTLFKRVFALATRDYVAQAFAALPSGIRPDYISLHVYPYDDRPPIQAKADVKRRVDSVITELSLITQGRPVWITEFGNINAALGEGEVAVAMSDLIDVFVANTGIGNLFYYKATGADQQLDILSGLGNITSPPLTRLAVDSGFSPTDGNFQCNRLNDIGQMYYLRAVGTACSDLPAAPVLVLPVNQNISTPRASFIWNRVAGATGYHLQLAKDSLFATPVLNDSLLTDTTRLSDSLTVGGYFWRVRTQNAFGYGSWSSSGRFNVLAILRVSGNPSPARLVGIGPDRALTFFLPAPGRVTVTLRAVDGKVVARLIDERRGAGEQRIVLPARFADEARGGIRLLDIRAGAARQLIKLAP